MIARLLACFLFLLAGALPALAQDEETETDTPSEPTYTDHLHVTAWGGTLPDLSNNHPSSSLFGGEIAYAFSSLDVGVLVQGYHLSIPAQSVREWTPVILLRLEQRFETRRGLDAVVAIGLGAAHTGRANDWQTWYQFTLGLRLGLGPLFIAGEIGFEQLDLLRLAAGIGFRI